MQLEWCSFTGHQLLATARSTKFAKQMKKEGFTRFEEVVDVFRDRFNDEWLRTPNV